jgi:hypothetical protein
MQNSRVALWSSNASRRVLSATCPLRETVNLIALPTGLVVSCWRRRVADQLVGDVGLDVIRQVEVALRGTDDESFEDPKYSLSEGVRNSFHSHSSSFDQIIGKC